MPLESQLERDLELRPAARRVEVEPQADASLCPPQGTVRVSADPRGHPQGERVTGRSRGPGSREGNKDLARPGRVPGDARDAALSPDAIGTPFFRTSARRSKRVPWSSLFFRPSQTKVARRRATGATGRWVGPCADRLPGVPPGDFRATESRKSAVASIGTFGSRNRLAPPAWRKAEHAGPASRGRDPHRRSRQRC